MLSTFGFFLLSLMLTGCYYDKRDNLYPLESAAVCDTANITYQTHILPILQSHCITCHHPKDAQGNVDLDGYEKVLIYANDGSLYGSIAHLNGYSPMPTAGQTIPKCEIQEVKAWVDRGAQNN